MKKAYSIKVKGEGEAELTYTFNGRTAQFEYEGMGMGNLGFQCEALTKNEKRELQELEGKKLTLEEFDDVVNKVYKLIKN